MKNRSGAGTAPLLIEIGTEELPVDALNVVYSELKKKSEETFQKNRLTFKNILVGATPRRIALFVESLAERQTDQTLEISGPSYDKAYDSAGKPTAALEGFLKSKKVSLKEIKIKETPKGKFVLVQKKETGRPAAAILPELLKEISTSLSFLKTMRWEASGFRFARPIRWTLALLDRKILSFTLADVKAGNKTFGHRFLSPKPVSVTRADWNNYLSTLKRVHVVLNLEERKQTIRKILHSRFHQKQFDEELVHMTAQLVEEPYLLEGKFSKTYLDLPAEVLASCMKKNQKIFACRDPRGHLSGRFAAVLNGKRNALARIKADYENVLESRLRDARYFYHADTKEPFEKKFPLLEQIVYLGKLGNMREKAERLEKLAEVFTSLVGRDDLKNDLKRAARLSKIDLMTSLVYEFPDLQGIAGREYALEAGEKEDVAKAIGTQYLPKNLTEDYRGLSKQMEPLGALFGIIDRLDHLAGAFGIGLAPTGSQDPYALRRAGGCFVKLIRAFRFHFPLSEAIEAAVSLYDETGKKFERSQKDLVNHLLQFFQERVIFEAGAGPGTRAYEILTAVFRSSFEDLADVYERYEVLLKLFEREPEAFLRTAKVVERTANIMKGLKGEKAAEVRPDLFREPLEKELYRLVQERSAEISDWLARRDYEKATLLFGKVFYHPVHDFFSQVLVNVEDKEIRLNRHALMKRINNLYSGRLADLSVLSRLDKE